MNHIENIILGAGPAGLQLGYFFHAHNIPYIILEKSQTCGSFFQKFPLSKTLISINKRFTGTLDYDFNLRHDWNSLIDETEQPLCMKEFSTNYYPSNHELWEYLNAFRDKFKLQIVYGYVVQNVSKRNGAFVINDSYTCDNLYVATGLSKQSPLKNISSKYPGVILDYSDVDMNQLSNFENKEVLILGSGNSALDIGMILNNVASRVHIFGKHPTKPWAMSSHYVGDVRAIYAPMFETFLLKSMNSMQGYSASSMYHVEKNDNNTYRMKCVTEGTSAMRYVSNISYIINASGWIFNDAIFDEHCKPKMASPKYPAITTNFESVNVSNMYFVGSLMHSIDAGISSGGFIHGFRYLIQHMFKTKRIPNPYNAKKFASLQDTIDHIIHRINTSSHMYQMHGQFGDVIYKNKADKVVYLENVLLCHLLSGHVDVDAISNIFIISLEYSEEKYTDLSKLGWLPPIGGPSKGSEYKSSLIHPMLRTISSDICNQSPFFLRKKGWMQYPGLCEVFEFVEDPLAVFTRPVYVDRFKFLLSSLFIPKQ